MDVALAALHMNRFVLPSSDLYSWSSLPIAVLRRIMAHVKRILLTVFGVSFRFVAEGAHFELASGAPPLRI